MMRTQADNNHPDTFVALGGYGNEWYFGYQHAHSDLTCNDFRSRDAWWDYCRYALKFFNDSDIPVHEMSNDNALMRGEDTDYGGAKILAKVGEIYALYLPDASNDDNNGGPPELDLRAYAGIKFTLRWYNPRTGEFAGNELPLTGGDWVSVGFTPDGIHNTDDWAAVVAQVPEPTSLLLLALGGVALLHRRGG